VKQKIILDTNVLVSALIQRNYPYQILKEIFSNDDLEFCLSNEILKEYLEVLTRDKFKRYPEFHANAKSLVLDLKRIATIYNPEFKLNIINDVDDNRFLELAESAKANYIVTGNYKDFTIKKHKNTLIVTPKEFWEIYNKSIQ